MRIYFKIFWQSLVLSFAEIWAAKLRSFLSLLGIAIGILCIISVRTMVSSLQLNIQSSFATLGNDVLYVQKWAWILGDDRDYPWWKFVNRPSTNRRELEQLQQRLKGAEACCILYFSGGTVIAGDQVATGTKILGTSYDYNKIKEMDFAEGRYFTPAEVSNSQPVALIGANVAESLFANKGPAEGKQIKINGVRVTVIGVLKKEGSDLFGFTLDDNVIVPFGVMNMFINVNDGGNDPLLAIIPKKGVPMDELRYEVKGAMRSIRTLSPYQDDNFAINQVSVFTDGIASIFIIINFAGFIIGGFSILVGTFGIANIMFVSVQERVYQIGIKKALGARKLYILIEFLLEAIILCVLGGLIGLIVVIALFKLLGWIVAHNGSDFKFYITAQNIIIGISISVITGIIAGFLPALSAANMKPVDAIRGEVSDLFKGFFSMFSSKKNAVIIKGFMLLRSYLQHLILFVLFVVYSITTNAQTTLNNVPEAFQKNAATPNATFIKNKQAFNIPTGGHLQGIQSISDSVIIITGSSGSYSYYITSLITSGQINSLQKIRDSPFRHAGGCQVNGNNLFVGVEDNINKSKSDILMISFDKDSGETNQHVIAHREGKVKRSTAGAVGCTTTLKGKYLIAVGDWDSRNIDFYISKSDNNTLFDSLTTFSAPQNQHWCSYQSINLLTDTAGNIYLIGFGLDGIKNRADLFKVEFKAAGATLTLISARNFKCKGGAGFRYGAGISTTNNGLYIYTCGRNTCPHIALNIFSPQH